jgi:hypothetical protein
MLFQATMMLRGKLEAGDPLKIATSFLCGLIGMLPNKHEASYSVTLHLVLSTFIGAFIFIVRFRRKLIARINGQVIVIWNILLLAIFLEHYGLRTTPYLLVAVPTLLTIVNLFSDFDKSFKWQVFFYTWFSIIITIIGIYQIGSLSLLQGGTLTIGSAIFDIFIAGASVLYILTNIFFVISLIPLKGKNQTYADRFKEIRAHMQLLAEGYIWKKDNHVINGILLVFLPLFFFINYKFSLCNENTMIGLTLVLTSFFSNSRETDEEESADNPEIVNSYTVKSTQTGA